MSLNFTEDFRTAMARSGLVCRDSIVADGKLHRFKPEGDSEPNGWYVLHTDMPVCGTFGCWKRGIEDKWHKRNGHSLSGSERAAMRRRIESDRQRRESEENERFAEAKKAMEQELDAASSDTEELGRHDYLTTKRVSAYGEAKLKDDILLLPMRLMSGELRCVQRIWPDGEKKFWPGGRPSGAFFRIPGDEADPVVICEGYATGASIHQATELEVLCSMNCGNLADVAQTARIRWPKRGIVVCGDEDCWKDPTRNPGREAATEAAESVRGLAVFPQFTDDSSFPTDFNDLHLLQGLEEVASQIGAAFEALPATQPGPEACVGTPLPPVGGDDGKLEASRGDRKALPSVAIPVCSQEEALEGVDDSPGENVDPFPTSSLPPAIAEMVREASRVHRVPDSLTGPCAVAVVAAALGRGLQVVSGPNRTTMGNVYILVTAPSGVGKSTVIKSLTRPFLDAEAKQYEEWEHTTRPKAQAESDLLEAEIARLKKGKVGGKPESELERRDTMQLIEEKRRRLDELKDELLPPRLVVENITSERLSAIMEENGETIFSCSADASDVFSVLRGGYKKDGSDENIYLKGYSGDHVLVDRVNREPVSLDRPCLSLLWLTQPERLLDLLSRPEFVHGGLMPRIMLCHANAKVARLEGEIPPMDDSVIGRYGEVILALIATYRLGAESKPFTSDPEATLELGRYFNGVADRLNSGELRDITAFGARWAEWAWRLAVVLHAARWGNEAHEHSLSEQTARDAITVTEWFVRQQLQILGGYRKQAKDELVDQIRQHFGNKIGGFTAREAQRAGLFLESTDAKSSLDRLAEEGHLQRRSKPPTRKGGRPQVTYTIKESA